MAAYQTKWQSDRKGYGSIHEAGTSTRGSQLCPENEYQFIKLSRLQERALASLRFLLLNEADIIWRANKMCTFIATKSDLLRVHVSRHYVKMPST